jgi:hypothetical protein
MQELPAGWKKKKDKIQKNIKNTKKHRSEVERCLKSD